MLTPWQHYHFFGKGRIRCYMEFVKKFSVPIYPPGRGSSAEKITNFKQRLHRTVDNKETIEISPWGAEAIRNSMQALASAPKAVSFEVERRMKAENEEHVHFKSLGVSEWKAYLQSRITNTRILQVTNESQANRLARDVATMLQVAPDDARAIRAFALWDDDAAIEVLVHGLAAVPSLYPFKKLACVANVVNPVDDPRSRLFVHATFGEALAPPALTERVFQAYPPGFNPDAAALKRFNASVEDKIHQGLRVHMDVRGSSALMHVIRALCSVKGYTAEFRVDSVLDKKGDQPFRALRFKATRGQSWDEFNATDFTKTSLLKATSRSPVDKLSYAAVAEVRLHQAVAIHCYSDDEEAVSRAIKALAAVPRLTSGKKLCCVPSFGRAGPDRKPVLRLYLRRYVGQNVSPSTEEAE